jgi:ribosomal protein S18 acetylase RimI-like enzyme
MTVTLRPESGADGPFLHDLIRATIAAELGADAWPEPMRSHLVGIQCAGRRQSVRASHPDGQSHILLADGQPAGWLFTAHLPTEIRLVEIMVLASHRGQGIGSAAISGIIDDARRERKPVRLTVNVTNTGATRLYERLGFRRTGGDAVQSIMEWTP